MSCVTCCEVHHGLMEVLFLHLRVVDCEVEYPINHHFWLQCPLKINSLFFTTYIFFLSSSTLHVSPHSCPNETKDEIFKCSNTVAFWASDDNLLLIGKWPC